jgi:hypothetical protein
MKQLLIVTGIASISAVAYAEPMYAPALAEHSEVAMAAFSQSPDPMAAPALDSTRDALAGALLESISLGKDKQGRSIPAAHCRTASEGCERRLQELAGYLTDVGQERGMDPWLLAAIAVRESGLDPFVRGSAGELGILQIHPKRPDAKQVRFMRDAGYRQQCHRVPGACQREIVVHAAHILEQGLKACHGRLGAALGAYNTGRCGGNNDYTRNVLGQRNALHAAARARVRSGLSALALGASIAPPRASSAAQHAPRAATTTAVASSGRVRMLRRTSRSS